MIYSLSAFLITLIQLAIVVGSHALQYPNYFYNLLVYGSPFYLLMNIMTPDSALWDKNWLYILLLAYHVFKYFLVFRAQIVDDSNWYRHLAILFEAVYLCLSGYYLN
jgi:hypothetical protein